MPLESMYRQARAARIYDGPDEVHTEAIAKLELKKWGSPQ
jgi:acyl-CoA dehydrogenase